MPQAHRNLEQVQPGKGGSHMGKGALGASLAVPHPLGVGGLAQPWPQQGLSQGLLKGSKAVEPGPGPAMSRSAR